MIKDSKKKVQASIQGDVVRVSGKDRDSLQEIIALMKSARFRDRYAVYELPDELKTVYRRDAESPRSISDSSAYSASLR